jgi:arylsulfatase A-like enzyme
MKTTPTRYAALLVTILALVLGARDVARGATSDRPNIVIFLADDLGYADLGCQGCKDIPTPHIDSLAKNGVRFTDGYATHPVCAPSRAGLMTGMYQHRFGFEHNPGPERFAAPNFGLPRSVPTLAERLKAAGYATGMIGKWHLGYKEGLRPWERGFDHFFGFLSGARSYYPDNPREQDPLVCNGHPVTDEKEYLTDAFAREAVAFIDRSRDKPWFLYLAFNAVHSPMEATDKYTARFPNLTGNRRTYAGMLSAMDDAVGRVLAKVRDLNQEENTLIFFYSDNGGPTPQTTSRNDPLRGYKGQVFEGGIRVPFLMQWKGVVPAGKVYEKPVMAFDISVTALTAAKIAVPADEPLDGVNLIPFVTGQHTGAPHEVLFWRAGLQHAVRMGDWKLVHDGRAGGQDMLFNLAEDIAETRDLAGEKPEVLRQLQAAFQEWDKQMMPAQWVRQDARSAEADGKPRAGIFQGTSPLRQAGRRIDEIFQAADRDGDARLSRDEFPRPAIFSAIDADGDGFVTINEVRAYYSTQRTQSSTNP